MTDEHTPEPWRYEGGGWVAVDDPNNRDLHDHGVPICTIRGAQPHQIDPNGRRIVACVNACKGIETEALENGAVAGFAEQAAGMGGLAVRMEKRADEAEALLDQIWSRIEAAEFEDIENDDDLVVVTFEAAFARKIRAFLDKHGKEQG